MRVSLRCGLASLTVLAAAGCASGASAVNTVASGTPKTDAAASQAIAGLKVGSGARKPAGPLTVLVTHFALFEREASGSWRLASLSTQRPKVTDFENQEVLAFSSDLTLVEPDYRTFKHDEESNTFVCWTGLLRTRRDNATTDYNPCESTLTKTVDLNAAFNVLATAVTAGAWALTGTSARNVVVDPDRVFALIRETGVMDRLEAEKQAAQYRWYQTDFSKARTAADYDNFVRRYSNNDPDRLVPRAMALREQAAKKEAVERRQRETAEAADRAQRAMEEDRQRQAAQERERLELARTESFRQSLRVGSETNCGPVLETRGELIKIYFPVQNYGNEHWIRRNDVFPAGYGCRFYNGQYQPPR